MKIAVIGTGNVGGTLGAKWQAAGHEVTYGSRWWGTPVNAEAKLLLLGHCFDDLGYGRVKIQTDRLNTRSQAAIAKLGAQREGVLRRHSKREDGTFRDTVVFSVLSDEWPSVKAGLMERVGGTATTRRES